MTAHDHSRRWPILLSLLTILALGQSRAAWYAKFDGVSGELTEGPFAGWTSVQSVGAITTNGPVGSPSFACEIRKAIDRTSPLLLQRCAEGELIRRVSLAYVPAQPEATLYRITLDNVLVSSVAHGSQNSPDLREKEQVAFTFGQMEVAFFELDPNGGTIGGLTGAFDLITGLGNLKDRPPFRAVITRQEDRMGVLVTWPAESGHTYRIRSCPALGAPWNTLMEMTASADGPMSQFVHMDIPTLFMRVDEVE